jgi:hypothetical protein
MYDDPSFLEKNFCQEHIIEYLKQAQFAELVELKKIISNIYKTNKKSISILDVGVGDGRIIKHICQIEEIWNCISNYDGIDNAQNCVVASNKLVSNFNLSNKVNIIQLDATNLSSLNKKYDLIICTWFTPGNFYPDNFLFEDYENSKSNFDLKNNPKFQTIFEQAYDMLNENGKIVLGSVYLDNKNAKRHQEAYYIKCNWHLITHRKDSFAATKEGYWSQRFSKRRIYDYFNWVDKRNIKFVSLDTYKYAMMVIISK